MIEVLRNRLFNIVKSANVREHLKKRFSQQNGNRNFVRVKSARSKPEVNTFDL